MAVLTIQDETATGGVLNRLELEIAQEMPAVRESIGQRVRQEVAAYNAQHSEVFQGLVLVLPTEFE